MEKLEEKVLLLHEMVVAAEHIVVHTGAGISTAAGEVSIKKLNIAVVFAKAWINNGLRLQPLIASGRPNNP